MASATADLLAALDLMRPKHPLEAEGWTYVDPPTRFSPEMWELFLSYFGEGEYRILVSSSGVSSGGEPWKRGQLMVSPAGMTRFRAMAGQAGEA